MEENLAERLKRILDEKSLSAAAVAKQAGVGQSFLYDVMYGYSKSPTGKKMAKIADILGVSLDYLIDGKEFSPRYGEGVGDNNNEDVLIGLSPLVVQNRSNKGGKVAPSNIETQYFYRKWIEDELSVNPDNVAMINVFGDYMEPKIYAGDTVLVDSSQVVIDDNSLFAIYDGAIITVRHLNYVDSEDGDKSRIKIISKNIKYDDVICDIHDIKMIGKLLWVSRKL